MNLKAELEAASRDVRVTDYARRYPDLIDSLIAGTHIVVPKEPTEAMCEAGARYYRDNWRAGHAKEDTSTPEIYRAMISAAPQSEGTIS